jgi:hypothetical protein
MTKSIYQQLKKISEQERPRDAIMINELHDCIEVEHEHIDRELGIDRVDWQLIKQRFVSGEGGREYDILTVKDRYGTEHEFTFDVTANILDQDNHFGRDEHEGDANE